MDSISRYRKLVVAGVGFALLLASNIVGVELGPEDSDAALSIVDAVIALGTTFGVFQVRNESAPPEPPRRVI